MHYEKDTELFPASIVKVGDRCSIDATVSHVEKNSFGEVFITWKLDDHDDGRWRTRIYSHKNIRLVATQSLSRRLLNSQIKNSPIAKLFQKLFSSGTR